MVEILEIDEVKFRANKAGVMLRCKDIFPNDEDFPGMWTLDRNDAIRLHQWLGEVIKEFTYQ